MYRYRDLVVEHFLDPASELPPSSREQIRMGVKDTFYKLYPDVLRYAKGENHDKLSFPYFVKLCFNPDQFAGFKNDAQMPPELQNNVDRLREHATRYFRPDEFG